MPTTTIESWKGPEHCDWQSMTFLHLGGAVYVRNPQPDLADFFATPYEEHADLPAHTVDTGYERNGDRLWLSTDRQRAFVGSEQGVEAWPRTIDPWAVLEGQDAADRPCLRPWCQNGMARNGDA